MSSRPLIVRQGKIGTSVASQKVRYEYLDTTYTVIQIDLLQTCNVFALDDNHYDWREVHDTCDYLRVMLRLDIWKPFN